MTETDAHPAPFIVLASRQAESALRGLGLTPAPAGALLRAETADPEAARAVLRPVAADWCVRAADAPAPRVFISDMDSSIIGQECIDELADFAGARDEVAAITERAMNGELDFHQALDARVAALAGQAESILGRCHEERVRLRPGAADMVAAFRRAGAVTALVSGGFDAIVARVAEEAGFDRFEANRLLARDGRLTGAAARPVLDSAAKAACLERLAEETGAAREAVVAMGDGANDVPMMRAAGFAIAIGGKDVALSAADAAVRGGDLSVVIDFLALR